MVKDTELYDRLEVHPTASDSEIKKAFLRLSKVWHPDKHPEETRENASKKFQEIQQAKETLMDSEKRRRYDQVGMDIFSAPEPQEHPFPFGMPGMGGFQGMHGFPGMHGMGQRQDPQLPEIVVPLTVTLENVYKEEEVSISYDYQRFCTPCNGEGASSGSGVCPGCNGAGRRVQVVQMGPMIQQSITECPMCRGKGKQITDANRCTSCSGSGYTHERKQRIIRLKTGLETGHSIHLPGKGHMLKQGRTDVQIVLTVEKHRTFRRSGNDLYYVMELALYQAMCGFDKVITHLDGRKLHVRHKGHTEIHTVRRIPEEGMRGLDVDKKGDLYLIFTVRLPRLEHLEPSIQEEWKSSLQSFDTNVAEDEKRIIHDFSTFPSIMIDASPDHLKRFYQLDMETEQQQQQQHRQQRGGQPPQPGCVHQ